MANDLRGFNESLGAFVTRMKDVTRAGAQAAADTFYREAKMRAPIGHSEKGYHTFYGSSYKKSGQKYVFQDGTLQRSIYQVYSKDNSSVETGRHVYHIAWNHKKCPYGFMVEFGTRKAPAHAFLRPAYEAAKKSAIDAGMDKMREALK